MAILPENSSRCPDLRFPFMNFVSEVSTELSKVLLIACRPRTSLVSPKVILSSISCFKIAFTAVCLFSFSALSIIWIVILSLS